MAQVNRIRDLSTRGWTQGGARQEEREKQEETGDLSRRAVGNYPARRERHKGRRAEPSVEAAEQDDKFPESGGNLSFVRHEPARRSSRWTVLLFLTDKL